MSVKVTELNHKGKGKIGIFQSNSDDPFLELDTAIKKYVGNKGYKEFVDVNMDNHWVRIVISDFDYLSGDDLQTYMRKTKIDSILNG